MKMRSEKEMFDLILNFAKSDERIRAVVMNGSRANMSSKKDCFQDYDIGFIVTDVKSFTSNHSWIDVFGEIMILQLPEDWNTHPYDYDSNEPFSYLMQFIDGTRIDLNLCTIDRLIDDGEPTIALMDKDGILPNFQNPTGECYFVKPPTEKAYQDCCNEFWWLCPYVAKELWREGLPFAKSFLEENLRNEFVKMINWFIGLKHDYKVSTGKRNKYIKQFLSPEDWDIFKNTYPDLNEDKIWASLFIMCDMFREKAKLVGDYFGYEYPGLDDTQVTEYLKHIRQLPKAAKSIY